MDDLSEHAARTAAGHQAAESGVSVGEAGADVLGHPKALDLLDDLDKGFKLGRVEALLRRKGDQCFLQVLWSGVDVASDVEKEELTREEAALHPVELPLKLVQALVKRAHPLFGVPHVPACESLEVEPSVSPEGWSASKKSDAP